MVKLTIVGRVSDGLPLAQGSRYLNEEKENMAFYKQQGEIILKEIARGALIHSKMSILVDHHSFNYLIKNGLCYITLCELSYPRRLAFHYLEDLQKEVEKVDVKIVEAITKPYCFIRIDNVIGSIRKQYLDTRTQSNLSKLKAKHRQDLSIVTEDISKIMDNRKLVIFQSILMSPDAVSTIWCSPLLEAIAMKWTPITILAVVTSVCSGPILCFQTTIDSWFHLNIRVH
ncbi:hypothetical protein GIB67_008011 [Kingdonia uniflora]|uniref:Longin domain-containing protein n=1 Tax=Kingdonia uniflora TaxID=39325 RepID=A0A7J7MXS7_9MAGN|nr:hypothetical protein GIB67_008011 [Kingdonia uniflora]